LAGGHNRLENIGLIRNTCWEPETNSGSADSGLNYIGTDAFRSQFLRLTSGECLWLPATPAGQECTAGLGNGADLLGSGCTQQYIVGLHGSGSKYVGLPGDGVGPREPQGLFPLGERGRLISQRIFERRQSSG